ncbi:MAG: efflux RND transporter periplasmic adaptor subunit [Rhodospirillales bacterium]|nr:efflux RND transporter periplasmic adaptor subunit [Rhodospirillales bacterium]
MIYLNVPKIFSACLLGTLLVCAPALAQEATLVAVDKVKTEPLKQTVPVIGRLIADKAGVIAARAAGPIGEMMVRVGDRVEEGDVIAVLVADSLHWQFQLRKAEAHEAEAALQTAKAAFDLRSQELKRLNRLKESAAFSEARMADKKLEVTSARSGMAESEAALVRSRANQKLAEINLYNTKVRAPFAGVVSKRHTDVGAYVNIGSPVVDLIDDRHLEIEASVPAIRIDGLNPGTIVTFQLEGALASEQITLPATVRAVVPDENPLTRTRKVRFTTNFSVSKRNLATNQSVLLALPAGEVSSVLTVHKDAVISRKGKDIVFIVEDGAANIRPVKLGEAVGTRFVVLAGLKDGDTVVVRGNERLRPGQKVTH